MSYSIIYIICKSIKISFHIKNCDLMKTDFMVCTLCTCRFKLNLSELVLLIWLKFGIHVYEFTKILMPMINVKNHFCNKILIQNHGCNNMILLIKIHDCIEVLFQFFRIMVPINTIDSESESCLQWNRKSWLTFNRILMI
jgi:hypothetical protein